MQGKVRQATWRARTIAPVFRSQDPMDALLSANSGNLPSDPNQDHFLNFKSPKTFSLPGAYILFQEISILLNVPLEFVMEEDGTSHIGIE